MSSLVNEHNQWMGVSPYVDGYIYIGNQGSDPTILANRKDIFSDRDLTIAIQNPQRLDAFGRSVNKIWVDGTYSVKVTDVNDANPYENLDNGAGTSSGLTTLGNVIGANDITAEAATTITEYVDKQIYAYTSVQTNTTGVTINIDSAGVVPVTRDNGRAVLEKQMVGGQVQYVAYNAGTNEMQWLNAVESDVPYVNIIGSVGGGNQDIDLTLGNTVSMTIDTAATTLTYINPYSTGNLSWFSCTMTNGGSQTITFPGGQEWANGLVPAWTISGKDIWVNFSIDGGITWQGFVSGSDVK